MELDHDLYNAAIIGENSESAFLLENNRLHPVEETVAEIKFEQSNPKIILPFMRRALDRLAQFAKGKVAPHFTDMEKNVSLKPEEKDQLIEKIVNIYIHLPHHERIELSSLVHHKHFN